MELPEAVRRQVAEAEELRKQMVASDGKTDDGSAPVAAPDAGQSETGAPEEKTDGTAIPSAPETAVGDAGVESEAVSALRAEIARLTQAHRVLKGKYDAEVPRLSQQLREREAELASLRASQSAVPGKTQDVDDDPQKRYNLTEDESLFGPDWASGTSKIARHEAEQVVAKAQEEIRALRYDGFLGRVEELVPKFREINDDAGFRDWLGEADPFSGRVRQEILDDAAGRLDAPHVARIFQTWIDLSSVASSPSRSNEPAKPSVESQRRPASAAPARPAAEKPAGRIYTSGEFMSLAAEIARTPDGKHKESLQAEYDAARRDGRIRD